MSKNIDWLQFLPENPKLAEKEISFLEELRETYNIPHNDFGLAILGSEGFSIRVQQYCYGVNREKHPEKSEAETLKMVLLNRYTEDSEEQINEIMKSVHNLTDLCEFVIKRDKNETSEHNPGLVDHLINSIVAGEWNAENWICSYCGKKYGEHEQTVYSHSGALWIADITDLLRRYKNDGNFLICDKYFPRIFDLLKLTGKEKRPYTSDEIKKVLDEIVPNGVHYYLFKQGVLPNRNDL